MSAAAALLDEFRASGIEVRSVEGQLVVNSASALSDETRQRIKAHKPGLLRYLDRERRRRDVLRMLDGSENQGRRTDLSADRGISFSLARYGLVAEIQGEYVIAALAIRDVGTVELTIDRDKWDGMKALELIERGDAVS